MKKAERNLIQEPKEGEELIKKTNVPNSPFHVISLKDQNQHFGCLGQFRITELHDTFKEAEKDTKAITWNRIIQVITLVNQITNEKPKK